MSAGWFEFALFTVIVVLVVFVIGYETGHRDGHAGAEKRRPMRLHNCPECGDEFECPADCCRGNYFETHRQAGLTCPRKDS